MCCKRLGHVLIGSNLGSPLSLGSVLNPNTQLIPIPMDNNSSPVSKLPIKRKTPDPNPPLKFHRIWTEPDEIRFLQGLLDSENLSFPRDLQIFYDGFSNTMSQPYTKSQLSEKLRRLRKKFRVISTRLAKGMDYSQLSLHDRALFDLAGRLWHPDNAATSPFNGARNVGGFCVPNSIENKRNVGEGLVGITVDFASSIPGVSSGFEFDYDVEDDVVNNGVIINGCDIERGVMIGEGKNEEVVTLSEVNVEIEGAHAEVEDAVNGGFESKVKEVAMKAVMGIFEDSVKELRGKIEEGRNGEKSNVGPERLDVRWKMQRIEELVVLGKRMRLVLENSLRK